MTKLPHLGTTGTGREVWQRIQDAYNILKNPKRRKCFDELGHEGLKRFDENRDALSAIAQDDLEMKIRLIRHLLQSESHVNYDEKIGTNGNLVMSIDAQETCLVMVDNIRRAFETKSSSSIEKLPQVLQHPLLSAPPVSTLLPKKSTFKRPPLPTFKSMTIRHYFELYDSKNLSLEIGGEAQSGAGLGSHQVGVRGSYELNPETHMNFQVTNGSSGTGVQVQAQRQVTRRGKLLLSGTTNQDASFVIGVAEYKLSSSTKIQFSKNLIALTRHGIASGPPDVSVVYKRSTKPNQILPSETFVFRSNLAVLGLTASYHYRFSPRLRCEIEVPIQTRNGTQVAVRIYFFLSGLKSLFSLSLSLSLYSLYSLSTLSIRTPEHIGTIRCVSSSHESDSCRH